MLDPAGPSVCPQPSSEGADHLPEGRTTPAPCSGAGVARPGDNGAWVWRLVEALTAAPA
jgi:hypothetical protein